MLRRLLFSLALILVATATLSAQDTATTDAGDENPAASSDAVQVDAATAAKYERFTKLLSGSKLVGKFTIVGREMAPPPEQYDILSIKKLPEGDFWAFNARIKYGKNNLIVPLKLEVKWAGDTPMITLTNFKIPTLGTFSSRVMFYNNKYAGTWTHGKVHGHMFGVIEKAKDEEQGSESTD